MKFSPKELDQCQAKKIKYLGFVQIPTITIKTTKKTEGLNHRLL